MSNQKNQSFEQRLYAGIRCASEKTEIPPFQSLAAKIRHGDGVEPYEYFFAPAETGFLTASGTRHTPWQKAAGVAAAVAAVVILGGSLIGLWANSVKCGSSATMNDMYCENAEEQAYSEMATADDANADDGMSDAQVSDSDAVGNEDAVSSERAAR